MIDILERSERCLSFLLIPVGTHAQDIANFSRRSQKRTYRLKIIIFESRYVEELKLVSYNTDQLRCVRFVEDLYLGILKIKVLQNLCIYLVSVVRGRLIAAPIAALMAARSVLLTDLPVCPYLFSKHRNILCRFR